MGARRASAASLLAFLLVAGAISSSASAEQARTLGLTADLTMASKYMTDGFKVGGDHPVWQPSLDLALPWGLSAMFWSAIQMERANRQFDELDFFAQYSRDFFEGTSLDVNLHGYYDFWLYPKGTLVTDELGNADTITRRGNKLHAGVSMPRLIPIAGSYLIPTYNAYYWIYWAQNRKDLYEGGARHELALYYGHDIPTFIPGVTEHYVGVRGTVSYNDGAFLVHPGWSHSTAEVTTGAYAAGCLFALSVNKQWSFEPTVDPTDELWTSLSLSKRF